MKGQVRSGLQRKKGLFPPLTPGHAKPIHLLIDCLLAAGNPEGKKLSPIPRGGVDNLEKEADGEGYPQHRHVVHTVPQKPGVLGGGLATDDQLTPGRLEGLARRGHSTPHMTS